MGLELVFFLKQVYSPISLMENIEITLVHWKITTTFSLQREFSYQLTNTITPLFSFDFHKKITIISLKP